MFDEDYQKTPGLFGDEPDPLLRLHVDLLTRQRRVLLHNRLLSNTRG